MLTELFTLLVFAAIIIGVIGSYSHRILRCYRTLYLVKTPVGSVIVGSSRFQRLTKAGLVDEHWVI